MESVLAAHTRSGKFHHGYLLAGDFERQKKAAYDAARVILNSENPEAHPDFFYAEYGLFGIEDSLILRQRAGNRPFSGESKVFILQVFSFSREAENALLKLFEEPTSGTYFFLIVPYIHTVIPTLLSRLIIIKPGEGRGVPAGDLSLAKEFLSSSSKKRFDIISALKEDKEKTISFLNTLEVSLDEVKSREELEELMRSRGYILDRAPSLKMILEHLALVVPRMYN